MQKCIYRIIYVVLCTVTSYVSTAQDTLVQIPDAVKISRDGHSLREQSDPYRLDTLQQGDDREVFRTCLDGSYYIGFQLFHDLVSEHNTISNWAASLEIALIHAEDTLWVKPLEVSSSKETFITTVFHNTSISCDGDYHFYILRKDSTGTVPWVNTYLKVLLFKANDEVFDPYEPIEISVASVNEQMEIGINHSNTATLAYDMEWVFISAHEGFNGASGVDAFGYKAGAGITTASINYKHQLLYPQGAVWYRVRAVGYNPQYPDHRIPGRWYYSTKVAVNNIGQQMNWQGQTVFAEEGKYKKVVNYFDGSLRQRQSQTNLSTGQVTMIAESYYDYEGRKSVDVLAAPRTTSSLAYTGSFNAFATADPSVAPFVSAGREKFHYDNNRLANSVLSTADGAARYYSSTNNTATIHKDFLPDAEGAVYSQTEYLRDGTGRIRRQSGVGKEFAMDGDHTTRYFYANPTPEELIRLFGDNAGVASHYKKNMVVDPNGQVSIQYLDQEDRVIATALAGEKPANVDSLKSYADLKPEPLTVNVISSNRRENNRSITVHKFLNTGATQYTFLYDVKALAAQVESLGCVSCTFDLTLSLSDPEGELVDLSSFAGNQSINSKTYERRGLTAASCTEQSQWQDVILQMNLIELGDYTLTKVLTAHEVNFSTLEEQLLQNAGVQQEISQLWNSYTLEDNNSECALCVQDCPEADGLIDEAIEEVAQLDCENILQNIKALLYEANNNNPDYEPTEAELKAHADYCAYELCIRDKESDIFDKQLARAGKWSVAVAKYPDVLNSDPFFNTTGLSGAGKKGDMQGKLNNILIGTLPYDSDGDGDADASRTYQGPIGDVTNPENTTYYVNEDGAPDVNGKHILYLELMNKRALMGEVEYQAELDRQRWVMYRNFYLEAKRKTKLEINDYKNCIKAKTELERPDELKELDTEQEIIDWGNANHVSTTTVTPEEVSMTLAAISSKCNTTFSTEDNSALSQHLTAYFNSTPKNFFRFIYKNDLNTSHLTGVRNILNKYNCSLDSIAVDQDLECVDERTVYISKNLQMPQLPLQTMRTSQELQEQGSNYWQELQEARKAREDSVQVAMQENLGELIQKRQKEFYSNVKQDTVPNYIGLKTVTRRQARTASVASVPKPSLEEYNALIALLNSTNSSYWKQYRTGWSSASLTPAQNINDIPDISTWYGITLDADGHIIGLNLSSSNITGVIPQEFSSLVYLQNILLHNNGLSGVFPAAIGDLPNLQNVQLGGNRYTFGGLLDFSQNFNGTFGYSPQYPEDQSPYKSINKNTTLVLETSLDANTSGCTFQWFKQSYPDLLPINTAPSVDNKITTINNVSVSDGGTYYCEIMHPLLPSLRITSGYKNFSIYNCESTPEDEYEALVALYQATNPQGWINSAGWAEGDITQVNNWYGVSTYNGYVESLNLSWNNLSGIIPVEVTKLCHLNSLSLNNNNLIGEIPPLVGELLFVNLSFNKLTGSIPAELSENVYLVEIVLNDNQLSGRVPPEIVVPWQTYYLDLYNNKFTFSDLVEAVDRFSSDVGGHFEDPQDFVDSAKVISVNKGDSHVFTTTIDRVMPAPFPACSYQWFKYVDGVNDIELTPLSTEGHTISLQNLTLKSSGYYYYKISNPYFDFQLTSRLQKLQVIDSLTKEYNICLGYNETNATLNNFSYQVNWNKVVEDCMANAAKEDSLLMEYATSKLIESKAADFYNSYRTKCFDNLSEALAYTYIPKEYHYTLYYYDQSANLVQTVPPSGVHPLSNAQVQAFVAGTKTNPPHLLTTRYRYNSLNQLEWQKTPDAGESHFWYNDLGQLKLSQNAQQYLDSAYSYTKYDAQGRVVEVGEIHAASLPQALADSLNTLHFPKAEAYALADITRTHYDFADPTLKNFPQTNLRSRVAWVEVMEKGRPDTIRTHYAYDIHGNVKSLLQSIPGLSVKRTDYVYDLISSKVNYVFYQYGAHDQFMHRYSYDADNRITSVHTSTDGFIWHRDASYSYYLHGPLARTELGEYRVQGLDYYYTLQGWIKGVNTPYADDTDVPNVHDINAGKDVFAYALGYYQGDYKPVNTALNTVDARDQLWQRLSDQYQHNGLYNGNISWMVTDLAQLGKVHNDRTKGMQAMLYQYDQLHRIVKSRSLTSYTQASGFTRTGTAYDESFTYDANGNILTLKRMDEQGALMDDFKYSYYINTNRLSNAKPRKDRVYNSGRLNDEGIIYRNITAQGSAHIAEGEHVEMSAIENIFFNPDFEARDGSDFWAHIVEDDSSIYKYDAIGNLIHDQDEGVKIYWTPYGKVREVHTLGDSIQVFFRYDGTGNRVEKKELRYDTTYVTRYVRDASGNVMTVYRDTTLFEQPIYGSSRLGQYLGKSETGKLMLSQRRFELSNHLGNVLAVISDNIGMKQDSIWASVFSTTDYYAFGLEKKGRVYSDSTSTYRYGFNGKEKDDNGEFGDTHYDYGFRIYNPSIGKFLSVDPLTKKYPMLTPYQFASNTPIWAIDVDGLEAHVLSQTFDEKGNFQSSSFTWDENASPVEDGQLHYNKTVGNTTTSSIEWADNIDYQGGNLNPTPAPSSILGSQQYYSWRDNDFNVRQGLMDKWYTWQPSSPDYYMGYGDKYVKRFSNELRPNLSIAGQEWLDKALINLQTAIEVKLQVSPSIEIENRAFQKFAFDSHVSSYENAGLFNLSISDLVKIGTTPDVSDLLSPNGLRQVREVASDYVRHAKENPIPTTVRAFQFGFSIYRNIRKQRGGNDED